MNCLPSFQERIKRKAADYAEQRRQQEAEAAEAARARRAADAATRQELCQEREQEVSEKRSFNHSHVYDLSLLTFQDPAERERQAPSTSGSGDPSAGGSGAPSAGGSGSCRRVIRLTLARVDITRPQVNRA